MNPDNKCPKCASDLEKGVLVGYSWYFIPIPIDWGTGMGGFLGAEVNGRKKVAVYRCVSCGYLESYALQ